MKKILHYFRQKKEKKRKFLKFTRQESIYVSNDAENTPTPHNTPRSYTNKRAILIGLNYPNSHYSLRGCVNDVKNGCKYLENHGYEARFLEDGDVSDKYNILEALKELRDSPAYTVFFHYSGHGTQVRDTDGDEEDGQDEAVFTKNGKLITDDEINAVLQSFPRHKKLYLIFDCCHSGTIADLPYKASEDGITLEKMQKVVRADIVCISGCKDNQTSADVTESNVSYGALSATLYNILRNADRTGRQFTWRQLYKQLLLEMSFKGYSQIPQLTSSDPSIFEKIVNF